MIIEAKKSPVEPGFFYSLISICKYYCC